MLKKALLPGALSALLGISGAGMAQQPTPYPRDFQRPDLRDGGMPYPMPPAKAPRQFAPPVMPEPPVGIDDSPFAVPLFPTPEELSRLAPPEPMTEEKLQQRFEKERQQLKEMIDQDRKSAEQYARDFARFQKRQSELLAEIMKRAEQRRQQMLQHLEEMQQRALESFRQQSSGQDAQQDSPQDDRKP